MGTGRRFIEKGKHSLRYIILDDNKLKKEEIEESEKEQEEGEKETQ